MNKILLWLIHPPKVYPASYHRGFLVPGGSDGPSGVLVCSENYLTYKNFGDQQDIRMPIPRRKVIVVQFFYFVACQHWVIYMYYKSVQYIYFTYVHC